MDLPPPLPLPPRPPDRRALDLYTIDELLGGWRADDDQSYAATYDAQTYRRAVAEGLRHPSQAEDAQQRALHDHLITRSLYERIADRRVVAIMGGHKLARDHPTYRLVAEISRALVRRGMLIVTGGGPGAMEAGHLGALVANSPDDDLTAAIDELTKPIDDARGDHRRSAAAFPHFESWELLGPTGEYVAETLAKLHAWQKPAFAVHQRWATDDVVSIGVPTWLYGHEPPTPLASLHAKYFENSIREDGLLAIATAGVIFAQGSAGTMQEVFQDAAQNHYRSVDNSRSPMVFLDVDEFWSVTRPIRPLLEGMFDEATEALMSFVTTVDDAVAAIAGGGA